jgi:hypothetical protein
MRVRVLMPSSHGAAQPSWAHWPRSYDAPVAGRSNVACRASAYGIAVSGCGSARATVELARTRTPAANGTSTLIFMTTSEIAGRPAADAVRRAAADGYGDGRPGFDITH